MSNALKMTPEMVREITSLGSIMCNVNGLEARGKALLNALADQLLPGATDETPKPVASPAPAAVTTSAPATPAPVVEAPPAPPAQPVTPAPTAQPAPATPAAAPAAPTPQAAMTPEELNNALVVEFQRLGGREGIDNALRELGATTVTDLAVENYQTLLDKVRAL